MRLMKWGPCRNFDAFNRKHPTKQSAFEKSHGQLETPSRLFMFYKTGRRAAWPATERIDSGQDLHYGECRCVKTDVKKNGHYSRASLTGREFSGGFGFGSGVICGTDAGRIWLMQAKLGLGSASSPNAAWPGRIWSNSLSRHTLTPLFGLVNKALLELEQKIQVKVELFQMPAADAWQLSFVSLMEQQSHS
ncbi:hypothetical protein GGX14DRAFT_393516 [Mycena pura]|uniref:Uncharacterized protein n=1 Tax=Mycena pura TaxID=153505 RepID=A0AAD6VI17_9AGAR|nr:hypothetical protein GGX14DRAFT_393516 [Mycena pura]